MEYANGDVYKGSWRYDRRFKGNITYKNNDKYLEYDGQWEYNIPNGYGTLTYKNKKQVTGFFKYEDGKFIISVSKLDKIPRGMAVASLIEDESIPEARVVNSNSSNLMSSDNYIGGPRRNSRTSSSSRTRRSSRTSPSSRMISNIPIVPAKRKAKGRIASIKRGIAGMFGIHGPGYTTKAHKLKQSRGGKSRKSRKSKK
jgi:hypothetical protein